MAYDTAWKDTHLANLCFDKEEFLKENFSVDDFLHKHRNSSSLEQLRDDLGLYLKDLRASMIDLINEDYADFVSLSANLVGLDQTISTIQTPLQELKEEILDVRATINENITEIREKLEAKRQLRERARNMESLGKVHSARLKLKQLLDNQLHDINDVRAVDLERAALDLVQLKFNEQFCTACLDEGTSKELKQLEAGVYLRLRSLLSSSIKSATASHSEALERCLRIYITLDACATAEIAFKEDIVAPYMAEIISEQSLQQMPQGLGGIYSKVLNFISLHMTDLLRLTQYTDKLQGFSFLINSFWSDVEMRLETHMASIFAPGNAEVFYAKYKCTLNFLSKIEELLANETAILAFRQHRQTKSFHTRWNLPVYFQICFQEIAGQLEECLDDSLVETSYSTASEKFELKPFNNAALAVERCWSQGIFLIELFPKFYKLHVQILLRLSQWIKFALSKQHSRKHGEPARTKTEFYTVLYSDTNKFIGGFADLEDNIVLNLKSAAGVTTVEQLQLTKEAVSKSFADLKSVYAQNLKELETALADSVIGDCGPDNLKQVNDLPRLYRKTNREVPTRCSPYLEQMLRPLKSFYASSADYLCAVADVLTSVQKTEESLRRLKHLKGSGSQTTVTASNAMTDDDKIRMQLYVDVSMWISELAKLGFSPTDVTKLEELQSTAEEIRRGVKE